MEEQFVSMLVVGSMIILVIVCLAIYIIYKKCRSTKPPPYCELKESVSYQHSRPAYVLDREVTVTVIQGDITEEQVDVIVNAANGRLQHGGGVARAIASKAGNEINKEGQRKLNLREGHKLNVSEVLHTSGYNLPAKYVIHAVGPVRGKDHSFRPLLHKTFLNCLEYAEMLEAQSIAIPLISSGIYGGGKSECAESLVNAVIEFSQNHDFMILKTIRLVNIDDEATRAINTILPIALEKTGQKQSY
ncbi:O-acetyl-ADP-ribose deacetylase-like [Antedon mediterranea]|uniref:O-acetyl-ADP-ribose deacetylase-like n=1 Tax=Antedon mediterranea TaxID=105859 RepID=UPI003AF72FEC